MIIIPAIIPKNFSQIETDVLKVKDFATSVQLDISDGLFVKNRTWPYINDDGFFDKISNQELGLPFWDSVEYELHLMVENPELILDKWINSGLSTVIFQIEATQNPGDIISILRQNEIGVGIAIRPSTDNQKILPFIKDVDFIQIMGSDKLGFNGVELEEKAIDKIKYFRGRFKDLIIAIDIGVSRENAEMLIDAGVNKLVSGSAIFESGNIKEEIEFFREL